MLFRPFVLLCLLLWSAGVLASPGSVVFKSFKDRSLALKESAQISRQFGIEARIEEARVNGMLYHRVLGPLMDQASVRELIGQARSSGLDDVWVLSLRERPVVRIEDRAPQQEQLVARPTAELLTSQTQGSGDELSVLQARIVNAASLSSGKSGTMRIARVEDANLKIEGLVDESIWSEIPAFDRMRVINPDTLLEARYETKTRIFSD